MQGRLSDMVDGKIQAFPWSHWEDEFYIAKQSGIHLMEWTLDFDRICENPLMTDSGRSKIQHLCLENNVSISSLTGDCFMQAPFFKEVGAARTELINVLASVIDACGSLGIRYMVFPLVDAGAIENLEQEKTLKDGLSKLHEIMLNNNVKILFESDFSPQRLSDFILELPETLYGINYDIGNSAALGYSPKDEFEAYGPRICNVHIKDRVFGGGTVPLGEGNADFASVFHFLKKYGYSGNLILQTARSNVGDHAGVLIGYRDFAKSLWA